MHSAYSTFDEPVYDYELTTGANSLTEKPYPITGANTDTTLSIDTTEGYVGTSSLKWEMLIPAGDPADGYHQLLFANTNSDPAITAVPDAGTFEKYGISITDACINWATTEKLILDTQTELSKII